MVQSHRFPEVQLRSLFIVVDCFFSPLFLSPILSPYSIITYSFSDLKSWVFAFQTLVNFCHYPNNWLSRLLFNFPPYSALLPLWYLPRKKSNLYGYKKHSYILVTSCISCCQSKLAFLSSGRSLNHVDHNHK